ncbi:hypothetical protein ANN_09354 [Periplaneta americana]|uniref:Uncharacterized protein n=1 Tax=Periplaneta americana TaxID=6978 RepID=A0ABQ8TP14_PERAM|nr:hypothetical protein ANN_09354 [Periplaneta americana]
MFDDDNNNDSGDYDAFYFRSDLQLTFLMYLVHIKGEQKLFNIVHDFEDTVMCIRECGVLQQVLTCTLFTRHRYRADDDKTHSQYFEESWRDPTILAGLANLIKDSIVSELKSALARNTEVIEKLEASLREKDERIASLERKLEDKQDALEQYQRRQSLRIFGIPENNNEDTDQIAIEVAAKSGSTWCIDCIEVNDLLSAAPHTNDFHFSEFPSTASPPPTPATPNPLPVPSTSALLKSSFSSHPNTLKVAHINSQSLLCHFNEVQSIFSPLPLHAILISETWLKPSLSSSLVSLDNYTLCRNDRIGKRGGGVAMYVRSDLPFKIVYQSSNEVLEHPEYLFIEVGASNKSASLELYTNP